MPNHNSSSKRKEVPLRTTEDPYLYQRAQSCGGHGHPKASFRTVKDPEFSLRYERQRGDQYPVGAAQCR